MRIAFTARDAILDPIAVLGLGDSARRLARRLLELDDGRLGELRGAAGHGILVALGETAMLPWAPGVTYLARDPDAPRLLLPTMLRPAVAFDVFERAIARHAGALPWPWAVVPSPLGVISVANAVAIEREELLAWLDDQP